MDHAPQGEHYAAGGCLLRSSVIKGTPMEDAERLARATRAREAAMAAVREENERMVQEAARDRCDQCPNPKRERDEVHLSVSVMHCERPGPDCTALVCSHLVSEPSKVANRMVEHLAAATELAAAGVSWLATGADRLILTYRVPEIQRVAAVVGALSVEAFRHQSQAEPSAAADPARKAGPSS